VENVVNANMAALTATDIGGRVYNIACGHGITLNELTEGLRERIGAEVEVEHGPERPGDVRHSMADISRARADLGYEPAVTLDEGIDRTVKHYLEEEAEAQRAALVRDVHVNTPAHAPALTALPRSAPAVSYLVTGGAGFIGSHLVQALVERGGFRRIVILDDLSSGSFENIQDLLDGDRVTFVRGSVTDSALVDKLMMRSDQCIHLASAVGVQMIVNEPLDTLMRSVRGSNVVMHAATRNNVRVLFSSTSEVYGKQSGRLLTEADDLIFGSPSKGRWTYAIAKSFGEALIHGYHRQRGGDATIVRLFNCVGPRQTATYGMVLPRFVRQALAGDDLTVYGDGSQTRCFTHVRDTVAALLALSDREDAAGQTFNVGTAKPISIGELARRVIARTGSESGIVMVPYEEAYASGFEELGTRLPDTTALCSLTGWRAELTVNDAIDDVITHERARLEAAVGALPALEEGAA
jgi:UDP-glucose 4-epimerase